MDKIGKLQKVHEKLSRCRNCPGMCSTPVHGPALDTEIMLVGQAPGAHESHLGRPFAYTAGKTLFGWLCQATGLDEQSLREKIYFSAVARCFPGKAGKGDRVPTQEEILSCRPFLKAEVQTIKPKVLLAVGRLAISEVLGPEHFTKKHSLADVVGRKIRTSYFDEEVSVICLPHPSGVSTWPQTEPGKTLLRKALRILENEMRINSV